MLNRNTIDTAYSIAETLDRNNIVLKPKPNTPLYQLVYLLNTDAAVDSNTGMLNLQSLADISESRISYSGCPEHTLAITDIINTCTDAIRKHNIFARTVVGAVIQELDDKLRGEMESFSTSYISSSEICTIGMPVPMQNSNLLSDILKFEDIAFDNPSIAIDLPTPSDAEFYEYIKTGSKSVDDAVGVMISEMGFTEAKRVWTDVFQKNTNNDFTRLLHCFQHEFKYERALLTYIIASNLVNNPPENIECSLKEFNDYFNEFMAQTAALLSRAYKTDQQHVKSEILVESINDNKITVNRTVYETFLSEGGTNEILFGVMVSGHGPMTYRGILERRDEYESAWQSQVNARTIREKRDRVLNIRRILRSLFINKVREIEATDAKYKTTEVMERFDDLLDYTRDSEFSNVQVVLTRLVCRSLYPDTAAEDILLGNFEVMQENQQSDGKPIPAREANAISLRRYITKWFMQQVEIVRK